MVEFNPGRLKLALFCHGARVDESCNLECDTRPVRRTRGGLGSGLDVILPGDVWVNIPIAEPFAKKSPFVICRRNGRYGLWKENVAGEQVAEQGLKDSESQSPNNSAPQQLSNSATFVCALTLPPRPAWYEERLSSGRRAGEIGVMQGSYFAVYPGEICGFWETEPRKNCRFCSVGLCHGTTEAAEKTVQDVVEAVRLARKHEKITFVHFNTGYIEVAEQERIGSANQQLSNPVTRHLSNSKTHEGLDLILPYVKAVKKETGLLVGVQCPPTAQLKKYDQLKHAGADHVSFCFELFDPERFAEVCPGKAETFGKQAEHLRNENDALLREIETTATAYLQGARPHPGQLIFYRALTYCSRLWGRGRVSGEIIAGLEAPERSIAAVNFLAGRAAVATVCVFRPCVGTDLEAEAPPDPASIAPVFARTYEACVQKRIPIGIAPNIKTAMVHLPQEGRWLGNSALQLAWWRKLMMHFLKRLIGFKVDVMFCISGKGSG